MMMSGVKRTKFDTKSLGQRKNRKLNKNGSRSASAINFKNGDDDNT